MTRLGGRAHRRAPRASRRAAATGQVRLTYSYDRPQTARPAIPANGLLRKRPQRPFGGPHKTCSRDASNPHQHSDCAKSTERDRNGRNRLIQLCKPEVTGSIPVRSTSLPSPVGGGRLPPTSRHCAPSCERSVWLTHSHSHAWTQRRARKPRCLEIFQLRHGPLLRLSSSLATGRSTARSRARSGLSPLGSGHAAEVRPRPPLRDRSSTQSRSSSTTTADRRRGGSGRRGAATSKTTPARPCPIAVRGSRIGHRTWRSSARAGIPRSAGTGAERGVGERAVRRRLQGLQGRR
jgi:hypothetical protein